MAYQMQCQKCKQWVNVDQYQINIPAHGRTRGALSARCAGSGKTPWDTKGWKKGTHPSSIVKGSGA